MMAVELPGHSPRNPWRLPHRRSEGYSLNKNGCSMKMQMSSLSFLAPKDYLSHGPTKFGGCAS